MLFEKYYPEDGKNVAGELIDRMMHGFDTDKSYADMMRYRISGKAANECRDVYYVAHNGEKALGRLWHGWGRHKDAIGNWGNFYTDENARGQGIGGGLLRLWQGDFENEKDPPLCFLCTAATKELTDLYGRLGFRPAIEGRDCGPLYRPCAGSPETFKELCEGYYKPSEVLYLRKATVEYRHEIDCLLKFAFINSGLRFGLDGAKSVEEALLYGRERAGMLFTADGHCVGWSYDGQIQLYPIYKDAAVIND